ncbi:hypothetical protein CU102_28765 [Phyllobacterium brassicacearum]|uniref:Uncharacterized protein n=1 Tax=Phyllobacterium brassicacearum TaxID=314235 RepID=A0A2P7AJV8_9HYPH|nr:hypothetical protein [Phyllobacterium brassicacearum]PSH54472.1 hypothetical protein CU102_28765 [Phyllobacterium brassicacearum]TDQ30575.1 hypothetical protein DEV91_108196 [Phyllobacterium brassicacearum]
MAKHIADLVAGANSIPDTTTLITSASSLKRAVKVEGTIIFYEAVDATFDGKFAGNGILVKMGPGALVIKHGDFFKGPRRRLEGGLSVLVDRI